MTAEKPGADDREPGGPPVPSGEETVVIRSSSGQAEGYSVRPRTQTGAQPPEAELPQNTEALTSEEDVLVLLPSEDLDNTMEMGLSQDVSWQTEAISEMQPGATEEFSSVHDDVGMIPQMVSSHEDVTPHEDVGFLPSGEVSALTDEVPILPVHPDFATMDMSEDVALADLPELEDVEDITALMEDESVQLEAPDEVFQLDLDELHDSAEPAEPLPIAMITTVALAAAAATVAAVFYFREAPVSPTPGGAEVAAVTQPANGAESEGVTGSEDGAESEMEAVAGGSESAEIEAVAGASDPSSEAGMEPTFEGWLERALERHLDVTSNVQG